MGHDKISKFFHENLMTLDEGMEFHFARFIIREMIFMSFSNDFHGILTIPCFIVVVRLLIQNDRSVSQGKALAGV